MPPRLKRVCEKLAIPRDGLLFGNPEIDDAEYRREAKTPVYSVYGCKRGFFAAFRGPFGGMSCVCFVCIFTKTGRKVIMFL